MAESITWREGFAARHQELLAGHGGPPPLASTVVVWMGCRQSRFYALSTPQAVQVEDGIADPDAFAVAAAHALARVSRELARHHDETLLLQLGLSPGQVRGVRAWARGTDEELAAAVERAAREGRPLSRAHLADGREPVPDLEPMVVNHPPMYDKPHDKPHLTGEGWFPLVAGSIGGVA